MTTYNGTSVSGTPGISSTSSIAEDAAQFTATGNANAITCSSSSGSYGVFSTNSNTYGCGVLAKSSATTTATYGCYGENHSSTGYALYGSAVASSGTNYGVYGQTASASGYGVYGTNTAGGVAACFTTNGAGQNALYVSNTSTTNSTPYSYGIVGVTDAEYFAAGVLGQCNASSVSSTVAGVAGNCGTLSGAAGVGAYANGSNNALYAVQNGSGYAANFQGSIYKSGGGFLIDHPLDPANRYLAHSFVESPDMKNVYDGVGEADAAGEIRVELPDYFDALNRDYRYQLTAMGQPAPALHVKAEIADRRFVIAGAQPGQRVSWQVTGIRNDAFARAQPVVVDQAKGDGERGRYRHAQAHGEPIEKNIGWPGLSARAPQ